MSKTRKLVILCLSILLLVGEIIGLVISYIMQKGDTLKVIAAYTQDSNIISMFAALVMICAVIKAIKNNTDIAHGALVFRYIATCLTTVTFLVVLGVLAPGKGATGGFVYNFTHGSLFWYHGFCPVLALILFLFVEGSHGIKLKNFFLALLPTFIYAMTWICLVAFNIVPDADAPYPFLRVHEQSVGKSVMWCCAILGIAAIVACILKLIDNKKKTK